MGGGLSRQSRCESGPCPRPAPPRRGARGLHSGAGAARDAPAGEVPEWSNGTVSKTVVRVTVPWVRIPPSPPDRVKSFMFSASGGGGYPAWFAAFPRRRSPMFALHSKSQARRGIFVAETRAARRCSGPHGCSEANGTQVFEKERRKCCRRCYAASSLSIAATSTGSAGTTSGSKRPTIVPDLLTRNFSKFQRTSLSPCWSRAIFDALAGT